MLRCRTAKFSSFAYLCKLISTLKIPYECHVMEFFCIFGASEWLFDFSRFASIAAAANIPTELDAAFAASHVKESHARICVVPPPHSDP